MKISEQTTLAELAAYLTVLGNPFITMMKSHPTSDHARHAITYLAGVGSFTGSGATEAEALEAAFVQLRHKLLPEALKQYVEAEAESEHDQYDRACGLIGVPIIEPPLVPRHACVFASALRCHLCGQPPAADVHLCHGCGHTFVDHPNASGCQRWHEGPK